jgi:hypothetical protein
MPETCEEWRVSLLPGGTFRAFLLLLGHIQKEPSK